MTVVVIHSSYCAHVLLTFFVIFCEEFHSVSIAQRKGDTVNGESEKHRIMCERSLDDDVLEILGNDDLKNELVPSESDSSDTDSDSGDETIVHVIPPDSLLLYCPLHLCFTANVGINMVV
jgi:hypothetical protein